MISFPSCKINLGLRILSRRSDGYHNIESILAQTSLSDILEITPLSNTPVPQGAVYSACGDAFLFQGMAIPGELEGNTIVKLLNLLRKEEHSVPSLLVTLHKLVPFGAGLGAGSSDAAFALRSINELFNLNFSILQMQELLAKVGADCPFFAEDIPKLATGTGTLLQPISLPTSLESLLLTIIKPPFSISTPQAYGNARLHPEAQNSLSSIVQEPIESWRELLVNDFEEALFPLYPQLRELKAALYQHGALYASLSGSGSALFALSRAPLSFKPEGCFTWEGSLIHINERK